MAHLDTIGGVSVSLGSMASTLSCGMVYEPTKPSTDLSTHNEDFSAPAGSNTFTSVVQWIRKLESRKTKYEDT